MTVTEEAVTAIDDAPEPLPSPPEKRSADRWLSRVPVPGHTIFYASLAGVLGGLLVAPLAYFSGWAPSWLAGSAIAGWRGLTLAGWAVVADHLLPSMPRPARWAISFFVIGLVPDPEVAMFAVVARVTGTPFAVVVVLSLIWIGLAAVRDGFMGGLLGWSVQEKRGARWKSAALAVAVWGAYRLIAILLHGPVLGLPVAAYGSSALLVQMTLSLLFAAALMGWAFAGRLGYAVETRRAGEDNAG